MKKYRIYGIIHDQKVIYVGLTRGKVEKRFSGVHPFIPKEIKKQSSPILLEETDSAKAEREWIKVFECCGWSLYNMRKGNGLDHAQYNRENQKKNFKKYYDEYYCEYWTDYREKNRQKYNEYMRNYMRDYKKKSTTNE
jgi:hypothetical protein